LLKLLEVAGCIVTVDALGTQTTIAHTILQQGGDYILAVKENQGRLYEDLVDLLGEDRRCGLTDAPYQHAKTVTKDPGRIETRLHWVLDLAFHEERSRVRKDRAPQNFAVLRQMALNLLE